MEEKRVLIGLSVPPPPKSFLLLFPIVRLKLNPALNDPIIAFSGRVAWQRPAPAGRSVAAPLPEAAGAAGRLSSSKHPSLHCSSTTHLSFFFFCLCALSTSRLAPQPASFFFFSSSSSQPSFPCQPGLHSPPPAPTVSSIICLS